jgi:membrane associated rhomboid family serine protease
MIRRKLTPSPKTYGWVAEGGRKRLKLRVLAAVGGLIVVAYALFYLISAAEPQGATSFGIANSVGLAGVVVALIAAGFIFRRATPQR